MEAFLVYILKSVVGSCMFYLGYVILFQNIKTFDFNRIYLLTAFIISYIIPLITFTEVEYIEASSSATSYITYTGTEPGNETDTFSGSWGFSLVESLYFVGLAGLLFILLTGYIKAGILIRRSTIKTLFNRTVYVTSDDVSPFSFFNRIVISQATFGSPNIRIIVDHEYIHVKEKHSIDILIAELLYVFQWFNPCAWLLKEAVKTNLEYITDHKIIQNYNATDYQLAIVSGTHNQRIISRLPSFTGSQLKSRITMMRKKHNRRYLLIRQFIVLPMLILMIIVLSEKEVRTEIIQPEVNSSPLISALHINDILVEKLSDEEAIAFNEVAGLWERQPVKDIIEPATNERLAAYSGNEALVIVGNGIKNSANAVDRSELQNAQLNLIDTLIDNKKTLINEEGNGKEDEIIQITSLKEPLYIVDGIITKHINQVPPEDIERIDMLNKETSIKYYGSEGKNGVVLISTKSKSYTLPHDTSKTVRPITKEQFTVPEVWPQFPGGNEAYQEYIESNMRYPQSAKEKGIQGNVHVTFKVTREGKIENVRLARGVDPALNEEAIRLVSSMPDWNPGIRKGEPVEMPGVVVPVNFKLKNPAVKVVAYNKSLVIPGPLYIVDGEQTGSIKDIDPGDIELIEVLKSPKATALYGPRGKGGVIIITTKQENEINDITSELELRRFFASQIQYPMEARKSGMEEKVSIVIDINNSNRLIPDDEFSGKHIHELPDIVVVGYHGKDIPVGEYGSNSKLLLNETDRIRSLLPEISIPGIKTSLIRINVDFRLQSEK